MENPPLSESLGIWTLGQVGPSRGVKGVAGTEYDIVKHPLQKRRKILSQDRPALEAGRCVKCLSGQLPVPASPQPMTALVRLPGRDRDSGCITCVKAELFPDIISSVLRPRSPQDGPQGLCLQRPKGNSGSLDGLPGLRRQARHCVSWETPQLRSWRSLWMLVRSGEVPLCAPPRPVSRTAGVGMASGARLRPALPPLPNTHTHTFKTPEPTGSGEALVLCSAGRISVVSPVSLSHSLLCPQLPD